MTQGKKVRLLEDQCGDGCFLFTGTADRKCQAERSVPKGCFLPGCQSMPQGGDSLPLDDQQPSSSLKTKTPQDPEGAAAF